jgi:hypothetical protein
MVAGFTLIDMYNYMENQPIWKKLKDALSWQTSPYFSVFILFMHSYISLLASPWQYPFLLLIVLFSLGVAAAKDRNFDDVAAYGGGNINPGNHSTSESTRDVASDDSSKSYTEMYKEMAYTAMHTQMKVGLFVLMIQIYLLKQFYFLNSKTFSINFYINF